jgi:hypothetical protein
MPGMGVITTPVATDARLPGLLGSGDRSRATAFLRAHPTVEYEIAYDYLMECVRDKPSPFTAGCEDDPTALAVRALEYLIVGPHTAPPVDERSPAADAIRAAYAALCERLGTVLDNRHWAPTRYRYIAALAAQIRAAGLPDFDFEAHLMDGTDGLPPTLPSSDALVISCIRPQAQAEAIQLLTPALPRIAPDDQPPIREYLSWLEWCQEDGSDLVLTFT